MTLASCIGCGCDDLHACVDDLGPCSWIVVDRDAGRGVCSCCESHMERWNAGDRSVSVLHREERYGILPLLPRG